MALRPTPKRNSVDYEKLDDLQKEIFGSENREVETPAQKAVEDALSRRKMLNRQLKRAIKQPKKLVKVKSDPRVRPLRRTAA